MALVRGEDRQANVARALGLIADDIQLERAQSIVIKPNFLSVTRQLAATHVDAVRAVLDFVRERTSTLVTIAESSATGQSGSMTGFRNFGYLPLAQEYGVQFLDLNCDGHVERHILDHRLQPLTVRLARTVVEADYRISVCPPKTHDCVIMTAGIKNMVMGSILRTESWAARIFLSLASRLAAGRTGITGRPVPELVTRLCGNDKIKMHQGFPAMHLNLCALARLVGPHLSVIDGIEGMEGEGPEAGDRVELGLAVASIDFVAADSVVAYIMGFVPRNIGYLSYCHRAGLGQADISMMAVVGEKIEDCVRPFATHPDYKAQLNWQLADVEEYLGLTEPPGDQHG